MDLLAALLLTALAGVVAGTVGFLGGFYVSLKLYAGAVRRELSAGRINRETAERLAELHNS